MTKFEGGATVAITVGALALLAVASARADESPVHAGGSIEYDYRKSTTQPGNAYTTDHRFLGALDVSGYLVQPWLFTTDMGGTVSVSNVRSNSGARSQADLLTGRVHLNVFPNSFVPLSFAYSTSNNVVEWINSQKSSDANSAQPVVNLNEKYRSDFLSARAGLIFNNGNRLDAFFNRNDRGVDKTSWGVFQDDTYGGRAQLRFDNMNLYGTATRMLGTQTATGDSQKSTNVVANLGIVPGAEFYLNTLATLVGVERRDGAARTNGTSAPSNGSFSSNANTDTQQVASYFYWRPEHKPFAVTGGARMHQRSSSFVDLTTLQSGLGVTAPDRQFDVVNAQYDFNANLAADYNFTPRLRVYGTLDFSNYSSETECIALTNVQAAGSRCQFYENGSLTPTYKIANNSVGSTQSTAVIYQSDKYVYRGLGWYWYADGGIFNKGLGSYESLNWDQGANAGVAQTAYVNWVTGNRGAMRVSLTQSGRQYFTFPSENRDRFALAHTASLSWNDADGDANYYAQMVASDNRDLGLDTNSQILNLQISGTYNLSRFSTIGAHVSAQSTRRSEASTDSEGFLTTATGRVHYNQARVLGIYRLRFTTRADFSWVDIRYGGARRQVDWQNELGYNIGRLSTALMYRMLYNEGAQDTRMLLLKINRYF